MHFIKNDKKLKGNRSADRGLLWLDGRSLQISAYAYGIHSADLVSQSRTTEHISGADEAKP